MRAVLWLLGLFALAVAGALLIGDNQGTITIFWPPHRIDLSFNLVLLVLLSLFLALHIALRTLTLLLSLPGQARDWRLRRLNQAIHAGLLDAWSHQMAGRFIRARKAAEQVVGQSEVLLEQAQNPSQTQRVRLLAHVLAAESAHALQDRAVRDEHVRQAQEYSGGREHAEIREGLQLRVIRWTLDDRQAEAALQQLDDLPRGVSHRTVALRLRFKAARMAQKPLEALETARLLTKHRAVVDFAVQGIVRGLALDLLRASHDPEQLRQAWGQLEAMERRIPDVATEAADRLLACQGDPKEALQWLLPVWDEMARPGPTSFLSAVQQQRLVEVMERAFLASSAPPDPAWLARIEASSRARPTDPLVNYMTGVVCLRSGLWGKAELVLKQALQQLTGAALRRNVWRMLAELAGQRNDTQAQAQAWRQAALE